MTTNTIVAQKLAHYKLNRFYGALAVVEDQTKWRSLIYCTEHSEWYWSPTRLYRDRVGNVRAAVAPPSKWTTQDFAALSPYQITLIEETLKGLMAIGKPYGAIMRARVVLSMLSGRLIIGLDVHHHNLNTLDDRPFNLKAWSRRQHAEHHYSLDQPFQSLKDGYRAKD